ncbi:MAG: peptide-methionine (R)-S-oxide reductase MsrB [Desulfurellaceae bacterium]|nr:peptide-methionine (R)-S-oxide reductase MsrB [Desulfurellaceae bacterium]
MGSKVEKTEEEWRAQLTPEQFAVCRMKATERPFSGEYNACKDEGIYQCVCCGTDLFNSSTKYESSSGWPSFWEPVQPNSVRLESDQSHGMIRTEVLCNTCDAHLGHVFDDGPPPTGQRYCMNSISLQLKK